MRETEGRTRTRGITTLAAGAAAICLSQQQVLLSYIHSLPRLPRQFEVYNSRAEQSLVTLPSAVRKDTAEN